MAMSDREGRAEVRLTADVETAEERVSDALDPDRKFIVVVIADLQGSAETDPRATPMPLYQRRLLEVDRDNLDEAMKRLAVRWRGRLPGPAGGDEAGISLDLSFRGIDDFHPDSIVQRVPALQRLHGLLRRLRDPDGMDEAEAELRKWVALPEAHGEPPQARAPETAAPASGGLLDSILEQTRAAPEPARRADPELQRFVREIVAPHLVRIDSARQGALRSALDGLLSWQVNAILHDPAYQALEGAWRSLYWLVRNVETDSALKIRAVHLRKDEILRDVLSGKELERSDLARLLLDPASVPGSDRPALLVGDYLFSPSLEDLAVLERLGNIGARLGAPFVAGASPRMFGRASFVGLEDPAEVRSFCRSAACESWRLLRKSRAARWVALAAPRLLCRLPYGRETDPAETFGYEEGIAGLGHADLLWGNAAFAVAAAYAIGFAAQGWRMNLAAGVPSLHGFPLYQYRQAGETVSQPCAEVLWPESMVEAVMEAGLLPVVSHRDADTVSLPSLQTIAEPRSAIPL